MTLGDYEAIIREVVGDPTAEVSIFDLSPPGSGWADTRVEISKGGESRQFPSPLVANEAGTDWTPDSKAEFRRRLNITWAWVRDRTAVSGEIDGLIIVDATASRTQTKE